MKKVVMKFLIMLMFSLALSSPSLLTKTVYADTVCQPIYGGGQTCITTGDITLDKTVMNPQTGRMVNSLSINDPKYQPGFIVTFQIAVTNTGSANISRISVNDVLPQFITFSSGPRGKFDVNTRTFSFETDNLSANTTRIFTIIGKVVDADQIPTNEGGVVCVVNRAKATNEDNTSQISQDNTQLCIEKRVLGVGTKDGFPVLPATQVAITPATGPEMMGLAALIPTGIAGWLLRKKSIKNNTNRGEMK